MAWARTGHPWVYRDDVAHASGEHGDIVRVVFEGRTAGTAFLGVRSKIALRWIERVDGGEPRAPDRELWRARLAEAAGRRADLARRTDAYRVIHDAADGIPGLVVDRYGPVAVVQTTIAGTERLLPLLAEELPRVLGVTSVLARNDLAVREREGLPRAVEAIAGEVPERVWVREEGPHGVLEIPVSPREGQKTGMYLDQRENRWRTADLARGRMLDAFAHAGLFGLHSARRASEVLAVDSSEPALALAEEAARRAGIANLRTLQANVFDFLKEASREGRRFETVVLDPPAFAKSKAEVPAAARGYREINRRAMEMLSPGGILVTCSCSYNLGEPEFLELLRAAGADARARLRVVERRTQASDHPVLLAHPESSYLKCVILERLDRS
jgi:23S rRNA (cytosine1962-C5)-methyltransferase